MSKVPQALPTPPPHTHTQNFNGNCLGQDRLRFERDACMRGQRSNDLRIGHATNGPYSGVFPLSPVVPVLADDRLRAARTRVCGGTPRSLGRTGGEACSCKMKRSEWRLRQVHSPRSIASRPPFPYLLPDAGDPAVRHSSAAAKRERV